MLADLERLRRDSSSARVEITAQQPEPKKKTLMWAVSAVTALALLAGAAFLWRSTGVGISLQGTRY